MAPPKQRSLLFHVLDVLLNIVIIVGIVAAIRTFLVSPFQVEGSSMADTLEHKQYIIINKLAYIIGKPDRGDIVVFRPPNDHKKHYVKRVIGVKGDIVTIEDGKVYLKTEESDEAIELEELYLNDRNAESTYQHPPTSGTPHAYPTKYQREPTSSSGTIAKGASTPGASKMKLEIPSPTSSKTTLRAKSGSSRCRLRRSMRWSHRIMDSRRSRGLEGKDGKEVPEITSLPSRLLYF